MKYKKNIIKNTVHEFSHSLKNSLTVIKVNLKLFERQSGSRHNFLEKINSRLDRILEDLQKMTETVDRNL
ncbi:hypothetical protein A3D05_05545 [Candidatus Gottesmanbacteria bacterium RIFCSPHIGHO2_02_FULL_40_24]|uniref:Uncharacterized protein n=1 Tax=Candidatus Gottesmanbacteria bacterium RIFCSPHIGHO2_01_FULL_40_15 TaxID=1798376 RepID=A0A1F5Z6X1_9BACT|nr:MAG: hypothetical protein A2777_02180 [Candidatus Gottesmanbacteria bacterium RIFCSPHIGHO2_01_FULL_40_15]OGG16493.1 MAG: hypothetical protein A3D05_05545 [Candidatus Gottesmanbacteria bacterium RIFCSPHIGHO2_02_FULL_40_24]OGG22571.1 MAG: hypothetical protein A3B48_02020 [Candidatus Gottesmanbacteria bacterium RIFCSPLOWO2_01_FULL_40_10]OGG25606.1 MAG: hypothetical protein A3E42_04695 [Candidatus Gottesmanbacteria bacterium RIFCSPHIGHO2_12_FULL_40_13]OGG32610.1 MAG: hypothetical protein A3I80_0